MQRQERMNVGAPLLDIATLVAPGDEISESHDVSPSSGLPPTGGGAEGNFLRLVDHETSPARQRYWRQAFDADGQAIQVRSGDIACLGLYGSTATGMESCRFS